MELQGADCCLSLAVGHKVWSVQQLRNCNRNRKPVAIAIERRDEARRILCNASRQLTTEQYKKKEQRAYMYRLQSQFSLV